MAATETTEDHRYEAVAHFVAGLIDQGTLQPGAKAPSLRSISQTHKVSVTTAMAAYRLLESRGVIEARPQSGFYVRARHANRLKPPAISKPASKAVSVTVADEVAHMLRYGADTDYVPLGCAVPAPELLASSKLDRFLARAARAKGVQANTYARADGEVSLRQVIAERAIRYRHSVNAEDLVITNGCTEALHLALRAVTKPGDTVAIESPAYFGFFQVLRSLSLKALELPTDSTEGVAPEPLTKALKTNKVAACVLSSSFNNPLGVRSTDERKQELLKILNKHKVVLIEDDIYGDIFFNGERPAPFSALDNAENVIYCSSFSKTVAPGYRIGWVSSARYKEQILKHKFGTTLCGPTLPQLAMADYLQSGAYDHHLRRIRSALAENVSRMSQAIQDNFPSDTRVSRPDGGFVLWVELDKRVSAKKLFELGLQNNICIAPGNTFTAGSRYDNFIRISCGYPWSREMERSVWKLGELVTQLLKSS